MKRIEVWVQDEDEEAINEQRLNTGRERFVDIELGVEALKHQLLAPLECDLLEREEACFVEAAKKDGTIG